MTLNANGPIPLMEAGGIASTAYGQYTGDGSGAITIPLGFSPSFVKVYDETDGAPTTWEWNPGLAATHTIKTVVSTVTLDTGSAITSNHVIASETVTPQYLPSGNGAGTGTLSSGSISTDAPDLTKAKLIFATGLNTTSSLYSWVAFG